MRAVSTRTRLLLVLLLAAIVGGVAAGVVLARGDGNGTLVRGHPGVLARGSFRAVTWGASGTATIVRDDSGRLKLRFSTSFRTEQAPELYVYLVSSARGRPAQRKDLGLLKRTWGSQAYSLPTDDAGNLSASVEIVCGECNSTFGAARLQPVRGV